MIKEKRKLKKLTQEQKDEIKLRKEVSQKMVDAGYDSIYSRWWELQTGHYLNIVDENYKVAGYGFSSSNSEDNEYGYDKVTHSNTFNSTNAAYNSF